MPNHAFSFYATAVLALLLVCAPPAVAQDEPAADPPPSAEEHPQSLFFAAAWCSATGSGDDGGAPGCDAGAGVALARYRRFRWVVVAGSTTIGTGIAWVPAGQRPGGPVFAVAAGLVTRYDSTGIATDLYPAIGATVGLGRPQ